MFIRSVVLSLIVISTCIFASGQTQPDSGARTSDASEIKKLRDLPFSAGIDLQFIIKELARDIGTNVIFDPDTFRPGQGKKTYLELRSVTVMEALNHILLQEGLYSEEIGPKTIFVASQAKQRSFVPQIGVATLPIGDQLADFFGVNGGLLIQNVKDNSPASKAGLKAGDVITEIDGVTVRGTQALVRSLNEKSEGDVRLTVTRNRKAEMFTLTPTRPALPKVN